MKFITHYFSESNQAYNFRVNLILGLIFYSFYALVDYFMMPINYPLAWMVRFSLIGLIILVFIFLSFYKWFEVYLDRSLIIFIYFGQIGIFMIMAMTNESERAYHEYFVGLSLVIFVAAFIFRVRLMALLWLTLFTIIVYNLHCIYTLDLLNGNIHSSNFALFFSSNTYLISSSILAIFGKYLIEIYRKKIENEKIVLQNALLKAKESDKIKSSFLHTMSHEIRTPLNSIIGFSDVLLDEPNILEKHHLIKGINRQGYLLLDVLTSMLEYSELQTKDDLGVQKTFPVAAIIQEAQDTFLLHQKRLDKFNIEFVSEIDDKYHELQVYTYADKLLSVLNEIVENAVKFSESGQIILMMKIENETDIILSLSDDGIGIENGLEHSIFQDFSQLETEHNRSYGGIGIGLSICNKIISLMDGRLWYEKKAGNGTTFHISLKDVFIIE